MLIVTARLTKWKIIAAALAVISVIAGFCALSSESAPAFAPKGKMSDAAARLEFIESLGWQVEEGDFMEINIPLEFDHTYESYNRLQKSQGMDLSKYKGKRAMHYNYTIKNYPTGEEGVQLTLIVYKDKVIAGDVSSPKLDEFMHGLKMPESAEK